MFPSLSTETPGAFSRTSTTLLPVFPGEASTFRIVRSIFCSINGFFAWTTISLSAAVLISSTCISSTTPFLALGNTAGIFNVKSLKPTLVRSIFNGRRGRLSIPMTPSLVETYVFIRILSFLNTKAVAPLIGVLSD